MSIYLIIIIILAVLAISDLIVGVSNDAVNFLNSAIGSKVTKVRIILIIASLGVFIGTFFSSGMMEIAKSGIFHPHQFSFSDVMVIFLAVMLTDIILLDIFNTFGLPTSTTVSIVFELLGASLAVALIKINISNGSIAELGNYINTDKALAIISAIFVSVLLAFSIGAIVQYLSRLLFTFNIQRSLKWFGSIWGGIAITGILYYMIIKGAKGASFITADTLSWINDYTGIILLSSFVAITIILQLLYWTIRLNSLKVIVLVGTFALAMAFASNDLVNFIGVPLAGITSYQHFISIPDANAATLPMDVLGQSTQTSNYYLIIAGLVMVLTLWLSKKTRNVINTTVDLGRQSEDGDEKFAPSNVSRAIVRISLAVSSGLHFVLPANMRRNLSRRLEAPELYHKKESKSNDAPAFDLLRASVNLMVSSMLIAFGTSMKLPLSTTYVTFMVAMGTSLSDKAWGRETAVYRVTGVLVVIGGWFLTAIAALLITMLFATILFYGGIWGIIGLVLLVVFLVIKSHLHFKKSESEKVAQSKLMDSVKDNEMKSLVQTCGNSINEILNDVKKIYAETIAALIAEKRKQLKKAVVNVNAHDKQTQYMKSNINRILDKLRSDNIENDYLYVQIVEQLREITHCLKYTTIPSFEHVENNHKGLNSEQKSDLAQLSLSIEKLLDLEYVIILNREFEKYNEFKQMVDVALQGIEEFKKRQIERIKSKKSGTKSSILYLNILSESKNLVLSAASLLKTFQEFSKENNEAGD